MAMITSKMDSKELNINARFYIDETTNKVLAVDLLSNILNNKHFIVLKFSSAYMFDVVQTANKISKAYSLSSIYIFHNKNGEFYGLCFTVLYWKLYKQIMFTKGIDSTFRKEAIKNKYGCVNFQLDNNNDNYYLGVMLWRTNQNGTEEMQIRNSVFHLIRKDSGYFGGL